MQDHFDLRGRANELRFSGKLYYALCAGIFLFMLVLNFLTPKCVDDYSYLFSLADNSRISSLSGIFSSLYAHAFTMNGRLAAHFFVYLFDMLPKPVFNIVNAGMFLLLVLLCTRFRYFPVQMGTCGRDVGDVLSGCGDVLRNVSDDWRGSAAQKGIQFPDKSDVPEKDCLLLLLLFCSMWVFEYDFGQVNLWLTGSCNYLWALVFSLLYILPFFRLYASCGGFPCAYREKRRAPARDALFLLFSFLCGAYNEVASSSMVFIACIFLLLTILNGRRPQIIYFVSVALAFAGFLTMFLAPAQSAKSGLTLPFTERLLTALEMYTAFLPLVVLWILLFLTSLFFQRRFIQTEDSDSTIAVPATTTSDDAQCCWSALHKICAFSPLTVSAVFLLGSLFSNFILVFAGSYAGRCAAPALVYLLIALAVLLSGVPADPSVSSESSPHTSTSKRIPEDPGVCNAPGKNRSIKFSCKKFLALFPVLLFLILLPFTVYRGLFGIYDIYRTGRDMRYNISVIEECRDSSETTAEIHYVYPATKYSAIYNLKYIDTETPETWPNESIAAFYGLDAVIGLP